MTTRITERDLEIAITRLNKATGQPLTTWTRHADNTMTANVGNYHLDCAYGGYKLVQTVNQGGGIHTISNGGYTTKRDLYNQLHTALAFLEK